MADYQPGRHAAKLQMEQLGVESYTAALQSMSAVCIMQIEHVIFGTHTAIGWQYNTHVQQPDCATHCLPY